MEVLTFGDGVVRERRDLDSLDPMTSNVLPSLTQTVGSLVNG